MNFVRCAGVSKAPSRRVSGLVEWDIRSNLRRFAFSLVLFSLCLSHPLFASGLVTECSQAGLENALSGGGTVTFACDGTIVLSNTITISQDTLLDASGRTVALSGNQTVRILTVNPGVKLSLVHLTIADGFFASTNFSCGGGIYNNGGTVAATNCTFRGNWVGHPSIDLPAFGGGLCNSNGTSIVVGCNFFGNTALGGNGQGTNDFGKSGYGGAICNGSGTLIVIGSLFATNRAEGGYGPVRRGTNFMTAGIGGAAFGGAIFSSGTLLLTNSTIFTNSAVSGHGALFLDSPGFSYPASGGGICNEGGVASIVHASIAANTAIRYVDFFGPSAQSSQGGGIFGTATGTTLLINSLLANHAWGRNCYGSIQDGGHNISSDDSCPFTSPTSMANTDPMIGPLGDYGGVTQVTPLRQGSPAIDAADGLSCPLTDQRGLLRPSGNSCDIGAVEGADIMNFPWLGIAFSPSLVMTGSPTRLTYTLTNPNDEPLNNVAFTNTLPSPLSVATSPAVSNFCDTGTVTLSGTRVIVTDIRLQPHQTCTISLYVTSSAHGVLTNVSGPPSAIETGQGRSGPSAVLTAITPCDFVYFGTNYAWDFRRCALAGSAAGFADLSEFTIEMWAQWLGVQRPPEGPYSNHPGPLFCSYQIDQSGNIAFHQTIISLNSPDPAVAQITWSPYGTNTTITSRTIAGDGVWHHLAVTFRSGEHRLYVDGMLEGSSSVTGLLDITGIMVGQIYLGFSRGLFDEMRLWSAVRTPEQLRQYMNVVVDPASESTLVGYWRLDEYGNSVQHDLTGHGHHLAGPGCTSPGTGPGTVVSTTPIGRQMLLTSQLVGDRLRVNLTGAAAQNYVLQGSADLIDWSDVLTNNPASNCVLEYEAAIRSNPWRFYRGISPR
jgi:hypothetical protein